VKSASESCEAAICGIGVSLRHLLVQMVNETVCTCKSHVGNVACTDLFNGHAAKGHVDDNRAPRGGGPYQHKGRGGAGKYRLCADR
jgi:hypothetical protein